MNWYYISLLGRILRVCKSVLCLGLVIRAPIASASAECQSVRGSRCCILSLARPLFLQLDIPPVWRNLPKKNGFTPFYPTGGRPADWQQKFTAPAQFWSCLWLAQNNVFASSDAHAQNRDTINSLQSLFRKLRLRCTWTTKKWRPFETRMIKTDKLLRLKTRKGKFLNVVREHYLRDDVACRSELCSVCEQGKYLLGFTYCLLLPPKLHVGAEWWLWASRDLV